MLSDIILPSPNRRRAARSCSARPNGQRKNSAPRYAVFVSKRPKAKLKLPSHVAVVDAREVLEALR
jgi:hypothetical protein